MDRQEMKHTGFGGRVSDISHRYEDKIRDHPFRSAAIALGVGAVTGVAAYAFVNRKHTAS